MQILCLSSAFFVLSFNCEKLSSVRISHVMPWLKDMNVVMLYSNVILLYLCG